MNLPKSWSYQTLNWNDTTNQLEATIEYITAISKFKLLNNNVLENEQHSSINFKIIDSKGFSFNEDSLNNLLQNNPKESEACNTELKNGIQAYPPFTFILQSNESDIEKLDFQITWFYTKQEIL